MGTRTTRKEGRVDLDKEDLGKSRSSQHDPWEAHTFPHEYIYLVVSLQNKFTSGLKQCKENCSKKNNYTSKEPIQNHH